MTQAPVYEMFWDCSYCGQTKNLGLTHRHCPNCGAPQQPDKRYFPPEDQKVAVQDHPFVGADLTCPACRAPASAAAHNCGQCGSPLEGAAAVAKLADAAPVAQIGPAAPAMGLAPTPPPKKRSALPWVLGVLGVLVLGCCVLGGVAMFWKREQSVTVDHHSWRRTITVERFQTDTDSAFCDSLPAGARVTSRAQRERGSRQVQDGQECTTRNVDNGDGTFRQEQDCRPRFRSEPTYADYCNYTIDRWSRVEDAVSEGQGTSPAPSWPTPQVSGCATIGCTRAGARNETYTLHLRIEGADTETCTVTEPRWNQVVDGSEWRANVGVLTDSVDCEEMQPL
ncbi:MAG: hypothetical protein AB7S26_08120 [Sandaracinaceae bacterium]